MEETIVYLPEPWLADDTSMAGIYVLDAKDVYSALDAAGVKWVQESPEELKIRMMTLQIEELKDVCAKLQGDLKEAQAENGSLAGLMADTQKHVDELYTQNEELKRAYLELQDQNAALKMTARTAQEELKAMKDHNAMTKLENDRLRKEMNATLGEYKA